MIQAPTLEASKAACGFEQAPDAHQVIYLTNSLGEDTGNPGLELASEDYDLKPDGVGVLLCYLIEYQGQKMLLANLEVFHKDEFWNGEDSDYPTFEDADKACLLITQEIGERIELPLQLMPIDYSEPGRILIGVAVPLSHLDSGDHAELILGRVFGKHAVTDESVLPMRIVREACGDFFDPDSIASVGACAAITAMYPHLERRLTQGRKPRIISEEIDEVRNMVEIMRSEIMTRIEKVYALNTFCKSAQ